MPSARAGCVASPLAGLAGLDQRSLRRRRQHDARRLDRARRRAAGTARCGRSSRGCARAGAVIVGKTNMTEFAYSGSGINPHYGTPRTPYDRATGRIPGGSSSGAAVSVTDGMAVVGDRHRHRRLGAHSGGVVRPYRIQADGAPRSAGGRVPALVHARFDRAAGAQRRRLRRRRCDPRRRGAGACSSRGRCAACAFSRRSITCASLWTASWPRHSKPRLDCGARGRRDRR